MAAPAEDLVERDAAIPDAVRAAWTSVTEQWDDPALHDALLAKIAQYSCYAWAAARYRERAGDPVAERQLERLRRAATATLLATATARPSQERAPYRATLVVFAILILALVLGLLVVGVLRARSSAHPTVHAMPRPVPQHAPHPAAIAPR